MKIAIATDHNGVEEKQKIINDLTEYTFIDKSTDNNPVDDYPDFAFRVAQSVIRNESDLGVLMCGTGIGMSIAANKVKGIRAAHCSTIEQARLAREHNNANIICISYKQPIEEIKNMIRTFVETYEERHIRRVNKIIDYERGNYNEL